MWRIAFLNLSFVVVLITILALRHSASVFGPAETRYELVDYEPYYGRAHAAPDQVWSDVRLGDDRLRIAIGYLSDLWQRSMIIREWSLEYEESYWERIRVAHGAETDLAEARFHVANAEVFGAATGEKHRAKVELDRADRYLQKAVPLVADNTLPAIEAIRKELTAAKMDLEMTDPKTQTHHERIKTDLDRVINSLHGQRL
jgi:hypothetical protein